MRVVTPRRKAAVILLLILIPLGILGMALHETFERQRDAAERHRRVLEIVSLVGTMENRLADMQVDLDGIVLFTDDTAVRQLERNYVAFLVGIGSLRQLVDGGLAASLTEIEAGVRAWRQRVAPETLRASGEASRGESVWLFRSLRTRIGDLRRRLFELLRTQERFLSGQAATQDDLFRRVVVEGALAVLGMGTLGGLLLLRERGRANHRLAADQERYRTLFEEAPIAYHEIDSAGVIRRVNRAECALLGFARDELLGRPVWELVAPAARESARAAVIRKLAGEAPLVPFQREYQRKDGGLVTVEIHENLIREAGGPGEGIRSALLDVTERKRAEELLRLRGAALGAAANAIVLTDRTGRIAWINPAFTALTGYTEPEAMGQNYAFLKSGQHDDVFHRRIWETVLAGEVWRGEVVNRRKDGALYPEEMTITPLRDAEGEISHFVAIKQDISERRSIERMKDEFVSVVSHELRTPLTSIRGSLGLLAGGVLGPLSEPGQRMVEIAVSNTDRLVRLINDILDIERMTSGKIVMRKAACDLGDLMRQAGELMRPVAEKAGVALAVHPLAARLAADPDRLIQLFTNLLSNAIKFSPAGGEVHLDGERVGEEVWLRVRDRGRGIPADKLERVFERFQQVDASDSREKGGTGLGLAICRSIASQHGGRIWAESAVGQGSTLIVVLPSRAEDCSAPGGPASPGAPPEPAPGQADASRISAGEAERQAG